MRWEQLVRAGRVQVRAADPDELQLLCASMHRQLANARVAGLTPDGRLQHVYSAVRQAATIAMRAEGYRTRGFGHHETTFDALAAIGPTLAQHVHFCQTLRVKRIDIEYSGDEVGAKEALTALGAATAFVADLEAWLATRRP